MKKLLFSAIALAAFSSVSMANTVVVASAKGQTNVEKTITVAGVSCTRRITTTCSNGDTSTGSYTATVPSTGDYDIDHGAACAKALSKAQSISAAGC